MISVPPDDPTRGVPQMWTAPVEIRARVTTTDDPGPLDPPPPGRRPGAGYGLLNLDLEALGRVRGGQG